MLKISAIIVLLCFVSVGCKDTSKKSNPENNHADTLFYENGVIKRITELKNGLKNGWQYEYSADGNVKSKAEYKDDIPSGFNYSYFENGKVESVGKWMDGKSFGDVTWFYKNGNIQQYSCYDFEGHARYREKYTIEGSLVSREGEIVLQLLNDSHFDSLYTNRTFDVHICVANPPYTKEVFRLLQYSNTQGILKDTTLIPVENIISLKNVFTRKGEYTQIFIGAIYDSNRNLLQQDSLITKFDIK